MSCPGKAKYLSGKRILAEADLQNDGYRNIDR